MNQFVEKSMEQFWKLWSREYLGSLRDQHRCVKNKNHLERDMICVGNTVLVSENIPRIKWKYGLVEELMRVKNRKIRDVCVLIRNKDSQGIIQRPVNKLYKLESLRSNATVQLKFIGKNKVKNVTSTK